MAILVTTDEWLAELRTRLPGISEGQLKLELRSTLREFFTKSGYWLEEMSPMNLVKDKKTYKVGFSQAQIMGVHQVWINGSPITLSTIRPKSINPSSATPRIAYMVEKDMMELYPTPIEDSPDALEAVVRLNPLPEMCKVPIEAVTHFFDEIMDGVLGRLFGMPGKPYTNLVQSQYHQRRFRDGISMARDMGRKRFGNATRPWSFPQGFSTNSHRRGNSRIA